MALDERVVALIPQVRFRTAESGETGEYDRPGDAVGRLHAGAALFAAGYQE
jgi:hypothetical protein